MPNPSLFDSFISTKKQQHGTLSPRHSSQQIAVLNAPSKSSGVIIACPGAGKTKILLDRVCKLIQAGVPASDILLITFTKEAANQFKTRLSSVHKVKDLPHCTTVHALAYRLLALKDATPPALSSQQEINGVINSLKLLDEYLEDLTSDEILLEINKRREAYGQAGWNTIVDAYEKELKNRGLLDFTALLKKALCHANTLSYKYVYVDEFQDLSDLQYDFISRIKSSSIWFVGDPNQAIYSFKGSSEKVLKTLTNGTLPIFSLSTNYRSCPILVQLTNQLIAHNTSTPPSVTAHSTCVGKFTALEFLSAAEEQAAIKNWFNTDTSVVLTRTNKLKEQLKSQGIKCLTVHESKGLEWDRVWVMGCEEGLFPHMHTEVEEERRLFYVATTRAKKELVVSYSKTRFGTEKTKSRFITELQESPEISSDEDILG